MGGRRKVAGTDGAEQLCSLWQPAGRRIEPAQPAPSKQRLCVGLRLPGAHVAAPGSCPLCAACCAVVTSCCDQSVPRLAGGLLREHARQPGLLLGWLALGPEFALQGCSFVRVCGFQVWWLLCVDACSRVLVLAPCLHLACTMLLYSISQSCPARVSGRSAVIASCTFCSAQLWVAPRPRPPTLYTGGTSRCWAHGPCLANGVHRFHMM